MSGPHLEKLTKILNSWAILGQKTVEKYTKYRKIVKF
jgi:hypothetical protein